MIVELLLQVIIGVMSAIDAVVPAIDWPDWLSFPSSWLAGHTAAGTVDLNGMVAYIHPLSIDLVFFIMATRAAMRLALALKENLQVAVGAAPGI